MPRLILICGGQQKKHYTVLDNGLIQKWNGRIWLNPPYSDAYTWLELLSLHGNGIALIFARTETKGFHATVFDKAHGLLFLKGRLSFHDANGQKSGTAGAPSVLIAYGLDNSILLEHLALTNKITGKYINLQKV